MSLGVIKAALIFGVAVGTALYVYFSYRQPELQHEYARTGSPDRDFIINDCNNPPSPSSYDRQCSICLDWNTQANKRLRCGHYFHTDCIATWLRMGRNNCPNCRRVTCSSRK